MTQPKILGGLEWSDPAVVLAIGRAESLAGAGRLLGCSHTTVFRRINAIAPEHISPRGERSLVVTVGHAPSTRRAARGSRSMVCPS